MKLQALIKLAERSGAIQDVKQVIDKLDQLMVQYPECYNYFYKLHTTFRKKLDKLDPSIYAATDYPASNEWTLANVPQEKKLHYREKASIANKKRWAEYRLKKQGVS
jgi:hypothetical protein